MRAPAFWQGPGASVLAQLLSPAAAVYGAAVRARLRFGRSWRCPVPVVCVGNLTAGGAGKTPVVLSIARRLSGRGVAVHALSRGYGGSETGPLRVSLDRYDARLVGDEPLLLADAVPTWVARDRVAGCRAAIAGGAELILMDDGFQNPSVVKDLAIVAVDGGYGFGNGLVMPAGPLREPVGSGLRRADAVVLIGPDETDAGQRIGTRCPVLRADVQPGPEAADLAGRPVVAFAGIGRPAKFFEALAGIGCDLRRVVPFADHHPYTLSEVRGLLDTAASQGAVAVTTTKDRVRIPPEARDEVRVLSIDLRWRDEAALDALLAPHLPPDGHVAA